MTRVRTEIVGVAGRITLDRPEALNALDLAMFAQIADALAAWRDNPRVALVIARGAGRAFSAGGDIRAVRDAVLRDDPAENERLYRVEYGINATIRAYPKPYVALVDGYCMGGGLGLAMHGSHVVVTERAQLAMPETAIGFFPDVGASYVLPRLPGSTGIYAGLTGARLDAADALYCGLATHRTAAASLPEIEAVLTRGGLAALGAPVASAEVASESSLAAQRATIDAAFAQPTVAAIASALADDGGDWALGTLATLRERSPLALCVSLAMMRRGASLSFTDALAMELRLGRSMTRQPDFREGVRALVIDKDRRPRWSPATIEEVDLAAVAALVADAAGD